MLKRIPLFSSSRFFHKTSACLAATLLLSGPTGFSGWNGATVPIADETAPATWMHSQGSFERSGIGMDVTTDHMGNIIVVGAGENADTSWEIVVLKYSGDGQLLWDRRIPSEGYGLGQAVAVDPSGNIYIGGHVARGRGSKWIIRSYSPDGTERWTEEFGNETSNDRISGMLVTGGRVIVSGVTSASSTSEVPFLVAWDIEGEWIWTTRLEGIRARSGLIEADENGGLFYIGEARAANDNVGYSIKKISQATGDVIWEDVRNHEAHARPTALIVTPGGDVIVTGNHFLQARHQFLTMKWTAEGHRSWMSPHSGYDAGEATAIATDGEGNIYVAGHRNPAGVAVLIKHSANGVQQWEVSVLSTGVVKALAVSNNQIFVAGYQHFDFTLSRFFVVCLNPDGQAAWSLDTPGETVGLTRANAIRALGDGTMVVTGSWAKETNDNRIMTIRAGPIDFPQLMAEAVSLNDIHVSWNGHEIPNGARLQHSRPERLSWAQSILLSEEDQEATIPGLLPDREYRVAMGIPTALGVMISPWISVRTFDDFQQWLVDGGLSPTTDHPTRDVDSVPLFSKFAFGIPAGTTDRTRMPVFDFRAGVVDITLHIDRPRLYYYPETSTDLVNWQRLHPISKSSGGYVTASRWFQDSQKRFVRIRVSKDPIQ